MTSKWTPLTGITGYSDDPQYRPEVSIMPEVDHHRDCKRWKESLLSQLPRKTSFHGFKHVHHKECWTVKVYPGGTVVEIEWFGSACCKDSAIAKAVNEYLEELTS